MATISTGRSFLATRRGKLTLALLCAVAFLDFVDASIVNIALPSIRRDLRFSVASLVWVVGAYLLTYGGFMLLGGRAADLLAGATGPGPSRVMHGARAVADGAATFARFAQFARPVLVNGAPGFIVIRERQPFAVIGFTVTDEKIAEIDILADPVRLRDLDLAILDE